MLKEKVSVPEACRKYGITQGEFRQWSDERLQAKIGELVMENEIDLPLKPYPTVYGKIFGGIEQCISRPLC